VQLGLFKNLIPKKVKMKSVLIGILFLFAQQITFAQDADKTVTLLVSGQGKTQEEAKQNAILSDCI